MELRQGLSLGAFVSSPGGSPPSDPPILVLRIDPRCYAFRLLSASEHGAKMRTAKAWSQEFGLVAAINASMFYDRNPSQSTGYMRNYAHMNNPRMNPAFGAFFMFNPVDASLPEVQMVDRHLRPDWQALISKYHTVIQNYRMVSGGQRRGWPKGERIYGTAAVGMDAGDRVLFILSRGVQSTSHLIETLISLPIGLQEAMYVEGGLTATLHLRTGGSGEGGLSGWMGEASEWELPNVIGIVEKR